MNKEEKEVLLDHNYDGIQEFDFSLPNWWLATFWGGIIFAAIYIPYYIFGAGNSLQHEYFADAEQTRKIRQNYIKRLKNFDDNKFQQYRSDSNLRLFGKSVFEDNCMACHNKNAAGDIGPNLTDNHWLLIEGSNKELFQFIISGNPDAGMPAWGETLSKDSLYAVVSYIKSIKGFKHIDPPAKEPQGDKYP
jgi:cytochrome c oxidase cbb3-type subunit III